VQPVKPLVVTRESRIHTVKTVIDRRRTSPLPPAYSATP
jgi:hypothetical protein